MQKMYDDELVVAVECFKWTGNTSTSFTLGRFTFQEEGSSQKDKSVNAPETHLQHFEIRSLNPLRDVSYANTLNTYKTSLRATFNNRKADTRAPANVHSEKTLKRHCILKARNTTD